MCFRCGRRVKVSKGVIVGGADHYSDIAEIVRKAKLGELNGNYGKVKSAVNYYGNNIEYWDGKRFSQRKPKSKT